MQNDIIIHDDFIGSGTMGHPGSQAATGPGTIELKLCASSCERFPTRLRYRHDG
jgi:hypothetical protein